MNLSCDICLFYAQLTDIFVNCEMFASRQLMRGEFSVVTSKIYNPEVNETVT